MRHVVYPESKAESSVDANVYGKLTNDTVRDIHKEIQKAMDIDNKIRDIEFGLAEPNNLQFTEKDGKILAEVPIDDLVSKEHMERIFDTKPDMVNHPPHYNVNGFEVIDIIKAFTEGLNGIAAVDTGNAIKYILRWHNKNGVEDLKKAKWYIEHLIKTLEGEGEANN